MSGLRPYSGLSSAGLPTIVGAGGWTRDAGVVRLTTSTDQVGVGTTTPVAGTKFEVVLDNGVLNALSDVMVITHTTTGLAAANLATGLLYNAEDTAGTEINAGRISALLTVAAAGNVSSALDFWTRSAGGALAARWRVTATGSWDPSVDATAGIGTALLRVTAVASVLFNVFAASGDTSPTAQLGSTALKLGLNSADSLSTRIYCSANKTLIADDGAAGPVTFSVLGTTQTQARVVATAFGTATPYTMTATDDFIGRDATAGNKIVNLLPAVTGRRVTVKNTGLAAVANTVAATPNGAETIDGVAAAVLLTGAQSITLTGLAGTGWYIS